MNCEAGADTQNYMLKRNNYFNFKTMPDPATWFSYIGAATAFILAALSTPILSPENPFGWLALPDTIILLLGGWAILKGKRFISVVLPAYMLASRYLVSEAFGRPVMDTPNFIVLLGYALGIIGTFWRDRARRIKSGAQDDRWIDKSIAGSFTLLAGAVGLGSGILVGIFSLIQIGHYTHFNLVDSLLIITFAWHTLKRRLWAAGSQVILSLVNVALSYLQTGELSVVFGFLPMFLLESFALGFIGVAVLRGQRQEELDAV